METWTGWDNPAMPWLTNAVERWRDAQTSNRNHQNEMERMALAHQYNLEAQHQRYMNETGLANLNANLGHRNATWADQRAREAQDSRQSHEQTMQRERNAHDVNMANLNDTLQTQRETRARAAETRTANRTHGNAKDLVTHIASTLGSVSGQGPITGMTVPGGSVTFGQAPPDGPSAPKGPQLPAWATTKSSSASSAPTAGTPAKKKRSPKKTNMAPAFSNPGGDPGPQASAPRTPRTPL